MSVDLFVVSGPNRGAYVPLLPGKHSVGASGSGDIVLDGVPEEGAIVFDVSDTRVRLTAVGGASVRVDGRMLGRGGVSLQNGSMIDFGDAELRLFWPNAAEDEGSVGASVTMGWLWRGLGVAVVLLGVALLLSEMWGGGLRPEAVASENPRPTLAKVAPLPEAGQGQKMNLPEPVSGSMLESLEARVKTVLRGTGLSGKTESGRLVISGSVLTAKDEKRLESMIAEVKPYLDVDVSGVRGMGGGNATPAAPRVVAPVRIVAINIVDSGPAKSYFETQDGARYFEGAIFGDGYVVSEIRPAVVAMEKGGRKVEYPLTGS